MHATDRVVVVGSGFGLWQGGRHLASARWSDVVRVRAFRAGDAGGFSIGVALRASDEVVIPHDLPGCPSFLKAAETALTGMRAPGPWMASEPQMEGANTEIVLYARGKASRS